MSEIIELGLEDCAIVFRADGSQEVFFPPHRVPEAMAPENAMRVLQCVMLQGSPEALAIVNAMIDKKIGEAS